MIFLEMSFEELDKKYHVNQKTTVCPWCQKKTNPKIARTKDSIGIYYECVELCGGWTWHGRPITEEAIRFWNQIV